MGAHTVQSSNVKINRGSTQLLEDMVLGLILGHYCVRGAANFSEITLIIRLLRSRYVWWISWNISSRGMGVSAPCIFDARRSNAETICFTTSSKKT